MSTKAVAVTGMGMVSPAGLTVPANWERLCSGRPTAATDPGLDGSPVDFSCRVSGFDPGTLFGVRRAGKLDRFTQFALAAATEAITRAGLQPDSWDGARVAVVLGTASGGQPTLDVQHDVLAERGPGHVSPFLLPMFLPNMVAGQLAIEFGVTGPGIVVSTACASGSNAIGIARDMINAGRCDIAICGGTETMITPLMMAGYARMKALSTRTDDPAAASRPFDADRDGLVASEGAGIIVLERPDHAAARGAHVHGYIAGYGTASDAYHPTAPDPAGRGLESAINAALADAAIGPSEVRHVNAHGTSTPLNDETEARVLRRMFKQDNVVTSIKGVTGHAFGAAGAFEAICTLLTLEHGLIPPTANLTRLDPAIDLDVVAGAARPHEIDVAVSNSLGFGGHNSVLVLTRA